MAEMHEEGGLGSRYSLKEGLASTVDLFRCLLPEKREQADSTDSQNVPSVWREGVIRPRRAIMEFLVGAGAIGVSGTSSMGCGSSSGGGGSPPAKSVASALNSQADRVEREPTGNGMQIQRVDVGSNSVSGEDLVYEVNRKKYRTTAPGGKAVKNGDVIDVIDLKSRSSVSIVVR